MFQERSGLIVSTVVQEERCVGNIERLFIKWKGMSGTNDQPNRAPMFPGKIAGAGIQVKRRDVESSAKGCEGPGKVGSAGPDVEYADRSVRRNVSEKALYPTSRDPIPSEPPVDHRKLPERQMVAGLIDRRVVHEFVNILPRADHHTP
jgi:hypothetical protein